MSRSTPLLMLGRQASEHDLAAVDTNVVRLCNTVSILILSRGKGTIDTMRYMQLLLIALALGIPSYGAELGTLQKGEPNTFAWRQPTDYILRGADISPDGRIVAYCVQEFGLVLCDASTGEITHNLGKDICTENIRFSEDGSIIAVTHENAVVLWNTKTGERLKEFDCRSIYKSDRAEKLSLHTIAITPDAKRVFAFVVIVRNQGKSAHRINCWKLDSGDVVVNQEVYFDSLPDTFAVSQDGSLLGIGSVDGAHTGVADAFTGKLTFDPSDLGMGEAVLFSADGKSLAVVSKILSKGPGIDTVGAGRVIRIDPRTGKTLSKVKLSGLDYRKLYEEGLFIQPRMAFSGDGRLVFSAYLGKLRIWDASTGKIRGTISGLGESIVSSISVTRDGSVALIETQSMTGENAVVVYRVPKGLRSLEAANPAAVKPKVIKRK